MIYVGYALLFGAGVLVTYFDLGFGGFAAVLIAIIGCGLTKDR